MVRAFRRPVMVRVRLASSHQATMVPRKALPITIHSADRPKP